jgi:hypothetical protein
MTRDEIAQVIAAAVGNPASGSVHDVIPTIADALDKALNPKPTRERRVVEPDETR